MSAYNNVLPDKCVDSLINGFANGIDRRRSDNIHLYDDYLNTDFIGKHFVTTPSLLEEFGENRKVDFEFGAKSVELMKNMGLYHLEPLFSKNGDLIFPFPILLIFRVQDSSHTWIDYRSVYIDLKEEISINKILKTKDSSFKIKFKSSKLLLNIVKIKNLRNIETEMIDEEIQLKKLVEYVLPILNSYIRKSRFIEYIENILPYFKIDWIYEIVNINQTLSTEPIDSVAFDVDIFFQPLSKRCNKYFDDLFGTRFSQLERKPKEPLNINDDLKTIVKEDL